MSGTTLTDLHQSAKYLIGFIEVGPNRELPTMNERPFTLSLFPHGNILEGKLLFDPRHTDLMCQPEPYIEAIEKLYGGFYEEPQSSSTFNPRGWVIHWSVKC